jgi:hypothetical protein
MLQKEVNSEANYPAFEQELDRLDARILLEIRKAKVVERFDLMRRMGKESLGTLYRHIQSLVDQRIIVEEMDGPYRKLRMRPVSDDITA